MPTYTAFKKITEYSDPQLSENLETNLIAYCNWAFLGIGAFANVQLSTSGSYGGGFSRLRPSTDHNFTNGQVWEGVRKDWIWESGVEYRISPINISGVYVNNTFYSSSTTGTYSHYVDYPNGRVIFNTALSGSPTVQAEYSFRHVQVYKGDSPWWLNIQQNSYRVDDSGFLLDGSGAWNIMAQNRVQLPAVIVEPIFNVRHKPFQIGNTSTITSEDVVFHIISEDPWNRKQLHDIFVNQEDKRILTFSVGRMRNAGAMPLNSNGGRVDPALMYPDLLKPSGQGGYLDTQVRFTSCRSQDSISSPPLYISTVRVTCEVDQ